MVLSYSKDAPIRRDQWGDRYYSAEQLSEGGEVIGEDGKGDPLGRIDLSDRQNSAFRSAEFGCFRMT
jgi:hypothetical protein